MFSSMVTEVIQEMCILMEVDRRRTMPPPPPRRELTWGIPAAIKPVHMARAYPFHSYPLQSYSQAGIWWAIVEQHEDVISLGVWVGLAKEDSVETHERGSVALYSDPGEVLLSKLSLSGMTKVNFLKILRLSYLTERLCIEVSIDML